VVVVDLRLTLAVALAEMVAEELAAHKTQMEAVALQTLVAVAVAVPILAEWLGSAAVLE
jgi:hypothetical protein